MILALEVFAIPRIGGGFTGSLFASEYTFIVEDHQRTPIHRTVRGGIRTLCGGQGGAHCIVVWNRQLWRPSSVAPLIFCGADFVSY